MEKYTVIELKNIIPRAEELRFKEPINWKIESDQHWVVVGANGAGKSLLIDILLQKHALHHSCKIVCQDAEGNDISIRQVVKSVAFKDIYSIIDAQESYYQQRWNRGVDTQGTKVKDLIEEKEQSAFLKLVDIFSIQDLIAKEVSLLSSGELRKFLIVRALLAKPQILILDNPYIGLDVESRAILNNLLKSLSEYGGLQIILVLPEISEIPNFITHILPLKDRLVHPSMLRDDFLADEEFVKYIFENKEILDIGLLNDSSNKEADNLESVISLKNIQIKYGERTILRNLNWEVKKGEKWALLGPNGAGKSTLLSLICGDNPQAYANDISLFGRKRGSGESIWDIKKHIGYVSPEMHLYYMKNVKCWEVVGSGFFDTVGLYRKCNEEQKQEAINWMKLLGIDYLKETSFLKVSTGEQRMILLARVLVKNPDLLILDEPMHGLDAENKGKVKKVIENFCGKDKTLIYVTHYRDEIPDIVDKELKLHKIHRDT